jgi:hypothetical protein
MKQFMAVLGVVGFAAAAIWVAYITNDAPTAQAAPKISPAVAFRVRAELAHEELANNVKLTKTDWRKSGFGTVMVATLRFHNANDVAVKDVEVLCNQYGPSGTQIGTTVRTIYRTFPPKADTTVEDFSMGFIHIQSASAGCKVTKTG